MMNILAFDTCLDKMYVALGTEDTILSSKIVETTKEHYHSAFLISTIKEILKENGLKPNDVDVVATNIGPGSFTGIRACTTVARVFAQGVNGGKYIKAVGISSLEILSRINNGVMLSTAKHLNNEECEILRGENIPPQNDATLVALDARKDMAYVAIYDNGKQVLKPQAMLLDEVKKLVEDGRQFVVTDDKLAPVLGGTSYQNSNADLGKILIEIAREKLAQGCETDWRKLHPLYIQPPPITVNKKQ